MFPSPSTLVILSRACLLITTLLYLYLAPHTRAHTVCSAATASSSHAPQGDGTFRQWCIESQSPGGAAKLDIGALNDAVLAIKTEYTGETPTVATVRTNPPGNLPGVSAIKYEGAVPVSKLTVLDSKFPAGITLCVCLYFGCYFFSLVLKTSSSYVP